MTKIEYNGSVVATVEGGNTATLPIKDLKMKSDIVITVPLGGGSADSPLPTEVSTEAEMTALLTSGEVGGVYKYVGASGTYENGALYVLEEEAVASYSITVNNNTHYEAYSDNPTQIKEGETVTLTFSTDELYDATASATNATCTYSMKSANSIRTLTVTLSNATDNVVVSIDAEGDPEPV